MILDCFWLEGVKVLFRFSLALLKLGAAKSQETASGELINEIRNKAKTCFDVFELKRVAFTEVKLPKRKNLASRRAFYVRQILSSSPITAPESKTHWLYRRGSEILGLSSGLSTVNPR